MIHKCVMPSMQLQYSANPLMSSFPDTISLFHSCEANVNTHIPVLHTHTRLFAVILLLAYSSISYI